MGIQFVVNKKRRCVASCLVCRRRKLKCDGVRPACDRCLRSRVTCTYAEKQAETKQQAEIKQQPSPCIERNLSANNSVSAGIQNFQLKEISPVSSGNDFTVSPDSKTQNQNLTNLFMEFPFHEYINEDYTEDINLELEALYILSGSEQLRSHLKRYNICYSLTLSLAFKSKSVMFAFSGLLLLATNIPLSEKLLQESAKLAIEIDESIKAKNNPTNDEINSLLVPYICNGLASSSRGDYKTWRYYFEKTYDFLMALGIDRAIELLQDDPLAVWILAWFFYQDIFKLGRSSKSKPFGPLFSKKVYTKIIELSTNSKKQENGAVGSVCGPLTRSCFNIFMCMGEVNTLFDLYTTKLNDLNDHYNKHVRPFMQSQKRVDSSIQNLFSSDDFKTYYEMKQHFMDFFQKQVAVLEMKILGLNVNLNLPDLSKHQIAEFETFHQILKDALKTFLRLQFLSESPSSFEIRLLFSRVSDGIESLVSWNCNNYLLFPLLVAGLSCRDITDKYRLQGIYQKLKVHLTTKNLEKVWEIVTNSWNSKKVTDDSHESLQFPLLDYDVCVF